MKQQHQNNNLLSAYFFTQQAALQNEIQTERHNELLNANETSYIEYLLKKYSIDPLQFHWDQKTLTDYDKVVSAKELSPDTLFLHGISSDDTRLFPQNTLICHVSFTGDGNLLNYRTMTFNLSLPRFSIRNNELTFEIPYNLNKPQETKINIERNEDYIRQHVDRINAEILAHNINIKNLTSVVFKKRKDELLKRSQLIASIGIPIKKIEMNNNLIIPIQKKMIITKPSSHNKPFEAEPTIDESTYKDILEMCHAYGRQMERLPSLYKDANGKIKCEESLRDLFLSALALQFDNTTGETFNKNGKTDILIRHEGKNAFIAECKFWHGAQAHQETISQLLGYLTWRDSKAAILYFVKNSKLQQVLNQIPEQTSQHSSFINEIGIKHESWFNYNLHLLEDESRNVKLAILLFHLI